MSHEQSIFGGPERAGGFRRCKYCTGAAAGGVYGAAVEAANHFCRS
ncbi:MAG: hypothetical protein ACLRJV_15985 [Eubacteriales bacterium]